MDYDRTARDILQYIGGAGNIKSLNHCFTRLRFELKDSQAADRDALRSLEGVISVVDSGGQLQVVMGAKVNGTYDAVLLAAAGREVEDATVSSPHEDKTARDSGGFWNRLLNTVSSIFTPMIPAIAASGLLKGFLTIARMAASGRGIDITSNDTYVILMAATDALFYFMPVILAYASAKVLGANEFVAMALGGTMCYPSIIALMTGESIVKMFGVTLTKANYVSSVIPILIGVYLLSYVQRFLNKVIPDVLKIILVPGLSLLIMVPAAYMVFGPIGIYIGYGISSAYSALMSLSPILCGGFVGGIWCVLVIFGAHRALIPIGINDVARLGRQNLLAFAGAANFSQGGAALGVFLKTKNKDIKAVAASASVSAAVCGITEPAVYGCCLRLKRPMIYAVICGAAGGAIMGAGGVYGDSFANNGVLTLAAYAAFGLRPFLFYLAGVGVSFFGSMLLTCFIGFQDLPPSGKITKNTAQQGTIKE